MGRKKSYNFMKYWISEALIIVLVRSVRSSMVTADPDCSLIGRLAFLPFSSFSKFMYILQHIL